jgi:ribosomal-protein-serine acetyltransferase
MLSIPSRSQLRRTPLVTPRLLLCPVEPPDGPDLWEAVANCREHLQRWLPWVPYNDSIEANQRYVDACASDWDLGRALRFSIRALEGGRFLGIVGLDSCVHLHRSCELGYWLRRDACGQGLMTEAAGACLGFAFSRIGAHRIRCAAATDNHQSLRVIGRLGFRFEGIARQAEFVDARWVDHAVFARLASDR